MNKCPYNYIMVTRKQKEFFNKLKEIYGNEPLPSFEKICKDFGYKSKNSVWQYFKKLIENGCIKEHNNRFFISPDTSGISYFESGIRAGFPSTAEECLEKKLSFDDFLINSAKTTFSVRVIGDSMIDAGIYEDDIAIVEKGREPQNGDVVIALVDGEFTIKFYWKNKGVIRLEPANKEYPIITAKQELQIFGVVTGIVRKLKFH